MEHFKYKNNAAYCEGVALAEIARSVGTPAYVYSRAALASHCETLLKAFSSYPTLACFAVKANSNLSVLREIFSHGLGADLVSVGEMERALLAGVKPENIVFSGVGKRIDEITRALAVGIGTFNVESTAELAILETLAAKTNTKARISFRINPNIDAKTNEKIATGLYSTKFGIAEEELDELLPQLRQHRHLELTGLACHIGSQITSLTPIKEAATRMAALASSLMEAGHQLSQLNMGGGLGIRYNEETPPALNDYAKTLIDAVKPTKLKLIIEPGRVLVGNIGVLLTRVLLVKKTPAKHFVVLDAAMNDLMRPSLYGSFHEIKPETLPSTTAKTLCDFVGPICETGDYLGKERLVPQPKADELFFINGCGAYAATMASQYNSRPRAPEILVDGDHFTIIKSRELLESLWSDELAALKA